MAWMQSILQKRSKKFFIKSRDLMLFSHGLFIIKSATGCSNGEPSELKMISA